MRMSTIVSWFTDTEIKLAVKHTLHEKIALVVFDDSDPDYFCEENNVYMDKKYEKKLTAAVEAFNKAWRETV